MPTASSPTAPCSPSRRRARQVSTERLPSPQRSQRLQRHPRLPPTHPSHVLCLAHHSAALHHAQIYPLDAVFDTPDDVPEDIKTSKRYAANSGFTVSEARQEKTFYPDMHSLCACASRRGPAETAGPQAHELHGKGSSFRDASPAAAPKADPTHASFFRHIPASMRSADIPITVITL